MDWLDTALAKRDGERARAALGTMNFGRRTTAREATRIVHAALERGVLVFDTANAYEDGESERILGEALRTRPEPSIVVTKVGARRVRGRPEGLAPSVLRGAALESRSRLGRDALDVLLLHQPDPQTPLRETLGELSALAREGVVRAWGLSNFASWQILDATHLAEALELPRPRLAQQLYNLLVRELEVEYLPFARAFGLHTAVYNPLAGGLLRAELGSSRFRKNRLYVERYFTERLRAEAAAYDSIARDAGLDLATLAVRFLDANRDVDSVVLGPATLEQLEGSLGALEAPLLDPAVLASCAAQHARYLGTTAHYARVQ